LGRAKNGLYPIMADRGNSIYCSYQSLKNLLRSKVKCNKPTVAYPEGAANITEVLDQ